MIQINHLASQVVPAVFLDYVAIQRAAKKMAKEQNLKCGFYKYDYEDLAGELALLILEQSPTHNPLKAKAITRAYDTLAHNLKFKGDAFDYKNSKAYSENQSDDSDIEDFDSEDALIGFEIKPKPRNFANEKLETDSVAESKINTVDEDGDDDNDEDPLICDSQVPQMQGLASLEDFEIRNLVDGLATVKSKELSDRRKREILQKNVNHFKRGDLFGGV